MDVETTFYVGTECCVLTLLASEDGCQSSAQGRDLECMTEACIDIKKLQQLLAGQQVNPTKALCSKFNSSACELKYGCLPYLVSAEYHIFCFVCLKATLLYPRTPNIYIYRQ